MSRKYASMALFLIEFSCWADAIITSFGSDFLPMMKKYKTMAIAPMEIGSIKWVGRRNGTGREFIYIGSGTKFVAISDENEIVVLQLKLLSNFVF